MGQRKFSIQDVHEKTKLSRTTISNLYNENTTQVNYNTILKLCELFECRVGELFYLEEENKRR